MVAKPIIEYVERVFEVPQVICEEKIVEIPEVVMAEVVRRVPKAEPYLKLPRVPG